MSTTRMQRSFPEVMRDIVGNLQEIVRSEFRLAKAEVKEEGTKATRAGLTLGVGLAFSFYGLGFLLLAAMYALSIIMAAWMAALIVGIVVAIVALGVVSAGRKQLKLVDPRPDKTIRSLQENVQWAKDQIR
jgi:uncharacterized membrane protein YqjE